MPRTKAEYALLWANGASFGEIWDLMDAEIRGLYATVVPPESFIEHGSDLVLEVDV